MRMRAGDRADSWAREQPRFTRAIARRRCPGADVVPIRELKHAMRERIPDASRSGRNAAHP
jgi:hypothetical protein